MEREWEGLMGGASNSPTGEMFLVYSLHPRTRGAFPVTRETSFLTIQAMRNLMMRWIMVMASGNG